MDDVTAIKWARGTVRAEMARRAMTYADLTERLRALGIDENERNLRNKIARGTFSAAFFLQCMVAMSVGTLNIDLLELVPGVRRGSITREVPRDDSEAEIESAQIINEAIDQIDEVLGASEEARKGE